MPISTSSYKVHDKYRKISGVRNLGPRTIDLTSIVVDIGDNHTDQRALTRVMSTSWLHT